MIKVELKPKTKLEPPPMYTVIMYNDDYTPKSFVVEMFVHYFNKSRAAAEKYMQEVHARGMVVCGTYPFDVASTKVTQVMLAARREDFPLHLEMEKELH